MLSPKTELPFPGFFFTGEPALVAASAHPRGTITVVHGKHCFSGEGCIFRCGGAVANLRTGLDGENCNTV